MPRTATIRKALIDHGLTVTAFAEKLGMNRDDCSKMIHGHRPFYAFQERAATFLGMPVYDLFPEHWDRHGRRRHAS